MAVIKKPMLGDRNVKSNPDLEKEQLKDYLDDSEGEDERDMYHDPNFHLPTALTEGTYVRMSS